MRVLIQNTITYLFLKSQDAATQDPYEARDFKSSVLAVRFIREHKLSDVQIVLKFPKRSDDVNLAIFKLLEQDQNKIASQPGKANPSGDAPNNVEGLTD